MGLFAFELKSSVGSACMLNAYVHVDTWTHGGENPPFLSCAHFRSQNCHCCCEKQQHKQHKSSFKSVKAAAGFSTPTSHVQNASALPTEAPSFFHSSVAEGMM